jgi:hypothetical protein
MRSITITDGNLFEIASKTLGNATMWIYLAELNKIQDPFIQGITSLLIPSTPRLREGGIVDQ